MRFCPILIALFFILLGPIAYSHVDIDYPKGEETLMPFKSITIKWTEAQYHDENNWDLYYSLDGGEEWNIIVTNLDESIREYDWEIPKAETTNALVKIIQDNKSGTDYEGVSQELTITSSFGGNELNIITATDEIFDLENNELKLSNYPNPFSINTTIRFFVPKRSQVTLSIINTAGKMIYFIPNKAFDKGTYELLWENNSLSSGTYLCRVSINEKIIFNNLMLRR